MPSRRQPELEPDEILPPHSADAELHCIGAVFKNFGAMANALDLPAEDFYVVKHRYIWQAMRWLWERGDPIGEIMVVQRLESLSNPPAATLADLLNINASIPTAALIGHYARIVRDKATLRRYAQFASELAVRAWRPGASVDDVQAFSHIELERMRDPTSGEMVAAEDLAHAMQDEFSARGTGRQSVVSTGLSALDNLIGGGLEMGRLILLMGVTGLGKTELALQIGLHVAQAHGPVLFASLEMEALEIGQRCTRILGGVGEEVLISGRFDDTQMGQVNSALELLSRHHLWTDVPRGRYSVLNLRSHAVGLRSQVGPLRLIVLDYVQRLGDVAGRGQSREQDVALMAERLKTLARELHCPVLALVQPNRDYANRRNKKPMLSDLRESGRLEIEADQVLGLYRDERLAARPTEAQRRLAEVYLLKNRSGVGGAINSHATVAWHDTKYVDYMHDITPSSSSAALPWQETA